MNKKLKKDRQKNLETILVLATVFQIYFIFTDKDHLVDVAVSWPLVIAVILGVVGVLFNPVANYITWFWDKLSEMIGRVMSTIILSLIYFMLLVPVALIVRLTKRNYLAWNKKGITDSCFDERNVIYAGKDMQNIW